MIPWHIIGILVGIGIIIGLYKCIKQLFFIPLIFLFLDLIITLIGSETFGGTIYIEQLIVYLFYANDSYHLYCWSEYFAKGGEYNEEMVDPPIPDYAKYGALKWIQCDRLTCFYRIFCPCWLIFWIYTCIMAIASNADNDDSYDDNDFYDILDGNDDELYNIYIVMSVGIIILMCSIMCCYNWGCCNYNKERPKDYNLIITEDPKRYYNARFRAKLCRMSYRGKKDYNRAYSMWTFAKIYLIWWIIANIILITSKIINITYDHDNYNIPAIIFGFISIIIHFIYFYGLYTCNSIILLCELIISLINIILSLCAMIIWNDGIYHIILIIVGLGTVYLYYYAWKWSKYVKPITDNDAYESNDNDNNEFIAVKWGTMDINNNDEGGIKVISTSKLATLIGKCKLEYGKWYYEMKLINITSSFGLQGQIGWCTDQQKCSSKRGIGTGNTKYGWAYDGYNRIKLHDYAETYYGHPQRWKTNDIIGCWLDLKDLTIRFSRNGEKLSFAFTEFTNNGRPITPSCSLPKNASCIIYFNKNELKYKPDGYKAISEYFKKDDDDDDKKQDLDLEEINYKPILDNNKKLKKSSKTKPKKLDKQSIIDCVKLLSGALSRQFNHDSFDICKYIYIHGGACRDAILNRGQGIKDIDISVDLNKIHQHAVLCNSEQCKLSKFAKSKQYRENITDIWETLTKRSVVYQIETGYSFNPIVPSPEERYGYQLSVGTILHEFIYSDNIINTKYLIKSMQNDEEYNRLFDKMDGPKPKTIDVSVYTIYLKNGVDIDFMDCQSFCSWRAAATICKDRDNWIDKKNGDNIKIIDKIRSLTGFDSLAYKLDDEYKDISIQDLPIELADIYPFTHKEHAKRSDCTFNAVYIKLSSIVNEEETCDPQTWYNLVIDPFEKAERADKDIRSIKDLEECIVRPYKDAAFWDMSSNDPLQSSSLMGTILSNAKSGQAELLIFRVIKNTYKLHKLQKPIKIGKRYTEVMLESYPLWFNVDDLIHQTVYNKKNKQIETALDKVLRHVFAHNYFIGGKIPIEYVIGVYHLLQYDYILVKEYNKNQVFKTQLEEAVEQYKGQKLWNQILQCGSEANRYKKYYPINTTDSAKHLFEEY